MFGFDDVNRNVRGGHTARIHLSFQDFWQFYACLFFLQFFFLQPIAIQLKRIFFFDNHIIYYFLTNWLQHWWVPFVAVDKIMHIIICFLLKWTEKKICQNAHSSIPNAMINSTAILLDCFYLFGVNNIFFHLAWLPFTIDFWIMIKKLVYALKMGKFGYRF